MEELTHKNCYAESTFLNLFIDYLLVVHYRLFYCDISSSIIE
jgi:hypothetical protein